MQLRWVSGMTEHLNLMNIKLWLAENILVSTTVYVQLGFTVFRVQQFR